MRRKKQRNGEEDGATGYAIYKGMAFGIFLWLIQVLASFVCKRTMLQRRYEKKNKEDVKKEGGMSYMREK